MHHSSALGTGFHCQAATVSACFRHSLVIVDSEVQAYIAGNAQHLTVYVCSLCCCCAPAFLQAAAVQPGPQMGTIAQLFGLCMCAAVFRVCARHTLFLCCCSWGLSHVSAC
jgi:hypothetical protein